MNVLIGCERSGQLRRRFRQAGHDAWSCDIEDAQDKLWWLQMAPNFVSSGFLITVGGKTFGADVVANKGE